jgi:hypothetical protein
MSLQASSFVASQEFSGNFPGWSLWGNKTSPSQNEITPAPPVTGTIFSPQETKILSLNGIKKSLVSIGPFPGVYISGGGGGGKKYGLMGEKYD